MFLDAASSLQHKGLLRPDGGNLRRLTGTGFTLARALAKEAQVPDQPAKDAESEHTFTGKNGMGRDVPVSFPRIAYIGKVAQDYNFFAFSVIYQANQGRVDFGGFATGEEATRERSRLAEAFQTWANRP